MKHSKEIIAQLSEFVKETHQIIYNSDICPHTSGKARQL